MTDSNQPYVLPAIRAGKDRRFCVQTTKEIVTPRRVVEPGQFLLIDPDASPTDENMVLADGSVVPWNGQPCIDGVVILVYAEM